MLCWGKELMVLVSSLGYWGKTWGERGPKRTHQNLKLKKMNDGDLLEADLSHRCWL